MKAHFEKIIQASFVVYSFLGQLFLIFLKPEFNKILANANLLIANM